MLIGIVASLSVLGLLFIVGFLVVKAVLIQSDMLAFLSLSIPIGGGILTWLLFLWGIFGLPISSISLLLICTALFLFLYFLNRLILRNEIVITQQKHSIDLQAKRNPHSLLWVFVGIIVIVVALISIGRSYSSYDAASGWAVKGYGIVESGKIEAAGNWGMWGLAYPLNLSLQIGLFKLTGGESIPGSKILFPVFYLCLLIGCYRIWRKHQISGVLSFLGLFFLGSNPLIFKHGTIGYANLPFTFYIVMGTIWAIEGLSEGDDRTMLLSGILLGLAAWTRPEGIVYCLAILLTLLITQRITGSKRIPWLPFLIPIVIISGTWLLFGRSGIGESHLGEAIGGVFSKIMEGQFNLYFLRVIPTIFIKRALQPDNWGYFIPVTLTLIILGLHRINPRRFPTNFAILANAIVMALIPIGLFYVRSFTRPDDFVELLIRSFDRAFLPAAFMLVILAILIFSEGDLIPEWLLHKGRRTSR